jgi:propanediol dehydratase small subunit
MDQEQLIKQIVDKVMNELAGPSPAATTAKAGGMTAADYPLGSNMPQNIYTPSGKCLADMKLEQMISGELTADDMRISPQTLEMQAQVAESVGRNAFARNLRRAAELIAVPDDRLLEIYDALRPYRSTKGELLGIADELQDRYGCKINAEFIRNAAEVYEQRGRLKKA